MADEPHDAGVRALYVALLEAWNRGSAEDFAALFAPDGTSVGFDGSQAVGAGEVRRHLTPVFSDHRTAAYVARIERIRWSGADTAVLLAKAGMVPPGKTELNPAVNAIQTLVAERAARGWHVVLFQNTPAQFHGRPELVEAHTAELEEVRARGLVVA
jgi:uncharacterized protein (TIGR02246 family)